MNINQIIVKFDNDEQLTTEEISALTSAYLASAEEARDWQAKTQDLSASLTESRAEAKHFRSELFKLQNARATYNRRKARAIARKLLTQGTAAMLVCLLVLCGGCFNYTGANHAKAVQEAKAYEAKATKAGANVKFIECMQHDTDGDGYIACDFIIDGAPATLDCAGKSVIQDNHGCKTYVAKLRVTNVNTNHGTH